MKNLKTLGNYALVGSALVGGAALAQATAIPTADVTAQLDEIEVALIAVGTVILTLAAVAVGFKWIKGFTFS